MAYSYVARIANKLTKLLNGNTETTDYSSQSESRD
jgi:hypothetical protein